MTPTSTSEKTPRHWHYIEICDNGSNGTIILEKSSQRRLATISPERVPNVALDLQGLSDPVFVELVQALPAYRQPIGVKSLEPYKPLSPFHSIRLNDYIKYLKEVLRQMSHFMVYVNVDELTDEEQETFALTGAVAVVELSRKDTIT